MNAREKKQAELEDEIENVTLALESQLSEYKEKGSNLLLIVGIIATAYVLYKLITDDKEDSRKSTRNNNFLSNAFWGLVSSVSIALLKDRLVSVVETFIENQNEPKE